MDKLKHVAMLLVSNAFFWIFAILASMVVFILAYERPVNFVVDKIYHLF